MSATYNIFTGKPDFTGNAAGQQFIKNGNTLELWWNGTMVESWTITPVAPSTLGVPYGLLLVLTQPA